MLKRTLDIVVASFALVVTSPLMVIAACGIRMTSPGPILYRARRVGRDRRRLEPADGSTVAPAERRRQDGYFGREFTMYKFRTMRVTTADSTPITAQNDVRVFPFGAFLRASKIDELPQLLNVLKGDMTLVGPRPEAPEIVRTHYKPSDITTLQVAPGVTSPGTIYYYTHCEGMLATDAVVDVYVQQLLPVKLALDRVYIKRATVFYDLRLIVRTIAGILTTRISRGRFPDPPELAEADIKAIHTPSQPH